MLKWSYSQEPSTGAHPNYLSKYEQIIKMWYIHPKEYYFITNSIILFMNVARMILKTMWVKEAKPAIEYTTSSHLYKMQTHQW